MLYALRRHYLVPRVQPVESWPACNASNRAHIWNTKILCKKKRYFCLHCRAVCVAVRPVVWRSYLNWYFFVLAPQPLGYSNTGISELCYALLSSATRWAIVENFIDLACTAFLTVALDIKRKWKELYVACCLSSTFTVQYTFTDQSVCNGPFERPFQRVMTPIKVTVPWT